ncbi:MAG: hypothetical protein JEZ02_14290 [Desulfatibacillum sp.]|nr:hypothetical protein [Desulfatibacillum sp.]
MERKCKNGFGTMVVCLIFLLWGVGIASALEFEHQMFMDSGYESMNLQGVSDAGLIVGFTEIGGITMENEVISAFSLPSLADQASTRPMDITNSGEFIAGYYVDSATDPNFEYGFIYDTGLFTTQTVTRSGQRTIINGINDSGKYVGVTIPVTGTELISTGTVLESFFWDGTTYRDVSFPDDINRVVSQTIAFDINDNNIIVGSYQDGDGWHGFMLIADADPWQFIGPLDYLSHNARCDTWVTGASNNNLASGYTRLGKEAKGLEHVAEYLCGTLPNAYSSYLAGLIVDPEGNGVVLEIGQDTRIHAIGNDGKILVGTGQNGPCIASISTVDFADGPDSPAQTADSPDRTSYGLAEIPTPNVIPEGGESGGESGAFFMPREINNQGIVVGGMSDPVSNTHYLRPFVWEGSGDPVLLFPEYDTGVATDINDHGIVAGLAMQGDEDHFAQFGYTPFSGPITGTMSVEYESSTGFMTFGNPFYIANRVLINNQGEMASSMGMPGSLWERGRLLETIAGFNGGVYNSAADLNEYGQVVGTGINTIFLLTFGAEGVIWDKDDPPARTMKYENYVCMPTGINNSGLVCGTMIEWAVTQETSRAFVREPGGTPTPLNPLPGYSYAIATDVNDDGEIVGYAYNDTNFMNWHLVMWQRADGAYNNNPVNLDLVMGAEHNFVPAAYSPLQTEQVLTTTELLLEQMAHDVVGVIWSAYHPKINNNGQIVTMAYKSDGIPVGVVLTPEEGCLENDNGDLDVMGQPYCTGGTLDVPIRIKDAPNVVDALGFEVTFDPAILQFDSVITDVIGIDGEILGTFDYWDANLVAPGVVRIGAYTLGNAIQSGADGILAFIRFTPITAQVTRVGLQNLIDDLEGWTATPGCLTRADGDINLDGDVSPSDALCALEKATLVCDTTCSPCESTPCDVNMDCDCTAADSMCMLNKYLELPSCLDDVL